MVSLTKLYNIKESIFNELKGTSSRNPARGNKGKDREKDWYFVDEPADPETGGIKSRVVKKISLANMYNDLEAETMDMQELATKEYPNDTVLYNIAEELKDVFNNYRQYLKNSHPEDYLKIKKTNE
tara:strand:+ start:216 stop:593 length:378 start_codon:yes stop_codon:yes gene_type:complete